MLTQISREIGEVLGQAGGQEFGVDHGGLQIAVSHEVADQHDIAGLQPGAHAKSVAQIVEVVTIDLELF